MKKRFLLFVLVIFLFPLALYAGQMTEDAAKTKGPVANVPEKEYKFDPVIEGQEIVHDFVVRNNGTEELKITKVKTT